MSNKDVTKDIWYDYNDGEALPITKCVCGYGFTPWEFVIYPDYGHGDIRKCPNCGAKLYWEQSVRVYRVLDDEKEK